jgi:arabinofuranosyltransferase
MRLPPRIGVQRPRAFEDGPPHGRRDKRKVSSVGIPSMDSSSKANSSLDVRPRRVLTRSVLVLPVVLLAVMGWRQQWMSDDGMINIRVVDQFFVGNGLVYNAGERVEVATSTLWLGILLLTNVLAPGSETSVVAVGLGWVLTLAGLAAAILASVRLHRGASGFLLPAGALLVAACPPMWDFTTSGLETGLTFAWIGFCLLALVSRLDAHSSAPPSKPFWVPLLIGLGPLVRPDLALMSLCFGTALLLQARFSLRGALGTLGIAAALPLVWEVFRMGYYAALVPNTAVAKSAADSRWDQGLTYLLDLVGRYALVVPLLILAALVVLRAARALRAHDVARAAVVLTPLVAGLLHGLYVVKVGGDFMHGRLLLPALFAVAASQAVIAVNLRTRMVPVAATVVALSALVMGLFIRFPYFAKWDYATGIADERRFYASRTTGKTLSRHDWRGSAWHNIGQTLYDDERRGARRYQDGRIRLEPAPGYRIVHSAPNLGVIGVVAGNDVLIADRHALADAVTARVVATNTKARIGHPIRSAAWRQARYAQPDETDSADVRAARAALRCGQLAQLSEAISAPLTADRFLRNLMLAPRLTVLSIPSDPKRAYDTFCSPSLQQVSASRGE